MSVMFTGGVLGYIFARWNDIKSQDNITGNHPANSAEKGFQPKSRRCRSHVHRGKTRGKRLSPLSDWAASETYHTGHDDQILV